MKNNNVTFEATTFLGITKEFKLSNTPVTVKSNTGKTEVWTWNQLTELDSRDITTRSKLCILVHEFMRAPKSLLIKMNLTGVDDGLQYPVEIDLDVNNPEDFKMTIYHPDRY